MDTWLLVVLGLVALVVVAATVPLFRRRARGGISHVAHAPDKRVLEAQTLAHMHSQHQQMGPGGF